MVVSTFRELVTRTHIGGLASRIYPGLDERLWNRRRDREMRAEVAAANYQVQLADLARPVADRPSHLVVVPQDGTRGETWKPGGGNFFYEISQAAREYLGAGKVTVFPIEPDEPPAVWHVRLIQFLNDSGATHVAAQIESNPNATGGANTWDTCWSQLSTRWDGVFLGVMFDSAFEWVTIGARRLARISPKFMLVDIGLPMDGVLVPGRAEVGPVNMPISNESLQVIDDYNAGKQKIYDVTFIGSLYPQRVELLDNLRSQGARIAVNPHRPDVVTNFTESRANQPSYLDYMSGLAQSNMTLNFSQSSAGPIEQLKTRVLEASLMGCIVLTDDRERTRLFFEPESEFGYFSGPEELAAVVKGFLSDPDKLAAAQHAAKQRARSINVTSFWAGIEAGLRQRGLPALRG